MMGYCRELLDRADQLKTALEGPVDPTRSRAVIAGLTSGPAPGHATRASPRLSRSRTRCTRAGANTANGMSPWRLSSGASGSVRLWPLDKHGAKDIFPGGMKAYLSRVMLIDASHDPLDFVYRVLGSTIAQAQGKEYPGKSVHQLELG